MDPELLKILCCPETRQELHVADPAFLEDLNRQVAAGQLRNRAGHAVTETFEEALVRADGKFVYAVRDGIPILLVEEGIAIAASA
jgi:uncharacterized protein YbaR (Trm112 family)